MDNNCHIHDLVQAFSNVKDSGLNLYDSRIISIIFKRMCEQNRYKG